jgi:hypothetical protein
MKKTGVYKIETSFYIIVRGILALGQLIVGIVKIGAQITLNIDGIDTAIKIIGYDMPTLARMELCVADYYCHLQTIR